jgi:hypothetical protein
MLNEKYPLLLAGSWQFWFEDGGGGSCGLKQVTRRLLNNNICIICSPLVTP